MGTLKIKRGNFSTLPVLSDGELAYVKDLKSLYIGHTGEGNILLGNMSKTIYDTNDDGSVDLADQALSMKSFNTSNTVSTNSNKWTKVSDIVIDTQYGEATVRFFMVYVGHSAGEFKKATIDFRVRQETALGGAPVSELSINESDNVNPSEIKAVITENSGTQTTVGLYMQIVDADTEISFIPLIRYANDAIISFYEVQAFTSALVAGTQIDCIDKIVSGGGSNIELNLSSYKTSQDSNGIYTTVTYKREDATNYMVSVLSGGTSPDYTTRTETYYDVDGTTVTDTVVYTITYDAMGLISSEVIQ